MPSAADGADIGFEPLAASHFPLLVEWFADAGVKRWWYSDRTLTLEDVTSKYGPRVAGHGDVAGYIAHIGGQPFGYIQAYPTDHDPDYHRVTGAAAGWVGIDFLVGSADFRDRGLGTEMIDAFVTRIVFADEAVTACMSGPEPANGRSIRALEKAGFERGPVVDVPGEHGGPEQVMVRTR